MGERLDGSGNPKDRVWELNLPEDWLEARRQEQWDQFQTRFSDQTITPEQRAAILVERQRYPGLQRTYTMLVQNCHVAVRGEKFVYIEVDGFVIHYSQDDNRPYVKYETWICEVKEEKA